MKTPNPRLRPLFNNTKSTARVELFIPAGAEIAVTDDVADQLPAGFKPADNQAVTITVDVDEAPAVEALQALVGEQGPEVVDLPAGTEVVPASKARKPKPKG